MGVVDSEAREAAMFMVRADITMRYDYDSINAVNQVYDKLANTNHTRQ